MLRLTPSLVGNASAFGLAFSGSYGIRTNTAVAGTNWESASPCASLAVCPSFPRKRESTATGARRLYRVASNRIAYEPARPRAEHRGHQALRTRGFSGSGSGTGRAATPDPTHRRRTLDVAPESRHRVTRVAKIFGPAKPLPLRVAIASPSNKPWSCHNASACG